VLKRLVNPSQRHRDVTLHGCCAWQHRFAGYSTGQNPS